MTKLRFILNEEERDQFFNILNETMVQHFITVYREDSRKCIFCLNRAMYNDSIEHEKNCAGIALLKFFSSGEEI